MSSAGSLLIALFILWVSAVIIIGLWELATPTIHDIKSRRHKNKHLRCILDGGQWHWFPKSSLGKNAEWNFDSRGRGYGRFRNQRIWQRSWLGELVERMPNEDLWSESVGVYDGELDVDSPGTDHQWVTTKQAIARQFILEFGVKGASKYFPPDLVNSLSLEIQKLDSSKQSGNVRSPKTISRDYETGRSNGSRNYREYLLSREWKSKRAVALANAGNKCQVCNSRTSLQVHHRTYDRIFNESQEDLIVLCSQCHGLFHRDGRMPDR